MKFTPKVLLYSITILVIIAAICWEVFMQQWIAEQPETRTDIMRSDLFVIWPLVLTLVSISLFRLFGKKR